MRRRLPVLAMIALLAVPIAGCSGKSSHAASPRTSVAATSSTDASDANPDPDASARVDTSEPAPDPSIAAALARTKVGQLMAKLGCSHAQLVETDPLSTETGMCQLTGDIIVATFVSAANRDNWVHQSKISGLGTVVGPLWAVGIEQDTDVQTVATKLGGTIN